MLLAFNETFYLPNAINYPQSELLGFFWPSGLFLLKESLGKQNDDVHSMQ
jgi:hypothetical protein